MREQHSLLEPCTAMAGDTIDGDAGERLEPGQRIGIKGQRDEAGPGLDDVEAKLPRDVIAKAGRAHFRNRLAARSDHQGLAGQGRTVRERQGIVLALA